MTVAENLSAAVSALQDAQEALVRATDAIEEHNIDTEAHADIRTIINQIMNSDTMYTREQIDAIVYNAVQSHAATAFSTAHPGWDTYEETVANRLAALELKCQELQDKLDGVDDQNSDLQIQLQTIENKYAPILEQLSRALVAAQEAGSTELADQYRETIAATLDQKKTELLEAVAAWQENN